MKMKHKRIFRTLLMAICATMACTPFTSCSDSETESPDVTESTKVALSISASKQNGSGTDARKADYDAEDFEDGDEIGLYVLSAEDMQNAYIDEETCYNVRAEYDGSSWTLDNDIYFSEDNDAYVIAYYPYDSSLETLPTSNDGTLLFDLTPSGNDQTDVLASEGVTVSSDSPQAKLSLSHVLTRITLTIEVADDITTSGSLTSASISGDELYGDVGLYIDENGSFQTYSTTKADDLTLSLNETLSSDSGATVDFLIPNESSATLTVALVIDGTTYSCEIEEDEWAAGYQYNYGVTVTTDEDDGDDDDDSDDSDDEDGEDDDSDDDDDEESSSTTYEAVDLGDDVSVLWATMNVGASSVEDYGNYYAWGEITVSSNGTYDSTSKFKLYGAYNVTDISGNVSYDAATYNWGNSWRMPTRDEMTELFDECTYETTTYNGVYGCLITGTTGKTIFLPSGGYYDTYGFQSEDVQGLYWTSTPTSSSRGAYGLKTITNTSSSATYSIGSHTRSDGYLIRAVQDKGE